MEPYLVRGARVAEMPGRERFPDISVIRRMDLATVAR